MSQFGLRHDLLKYKEFVEPEFIKKINNRLSISLSYLENSNSDHTECLLSFHNTLNKNITINPRTEGNITEDNKGWFSNIFGSSELETDLHNEGNVEEDTEIKIFLGYIQLFGCVILNYNFRLGESSNPIENYSDKTSWWENKEYAYHYQDNDENDEDDIETNLNNVPFVRQNLKDRMIIGGKLGGVSDLIIDDSLKNYSFLNKQDSVIEENKRYFLQDLLFPFGSIKESESIDGISNEKHVSNHKGMLSLRELTDSIIPFYTTSQYLLFSELCILDNSTKTFHLKFPTVKHLPPSYNTRMNRPVCDQGWITIKYLLIVGFLRMSGTNQGIEACNIYFPLEVEAERQGTHARWLQHDFLKETRINQDWKVTIGDDTCQSIQDSDKINCSDSRNTFLDDLSTLIDSDLYNMPKISTNERKKSVPNMHDISEDIEPGLIPQLPHHLKSQYQIRVNDHELCLLSLSKPYFHVGEDAYFSIDANPKDINKTRIAGLIVHLETHESFHVETEDGAKKDFKNIYKISSSIKFNSFASAIANSKHAEENSQPSLIQGMINIPKFINQQFQSSQFMDLKHYLVFKFNLNDFSDDTLAADSPEVNTAEDVESTLDDSDTSQHPRVDIQTNNHKDLDIFQEYKFDNYGGELRFRLPMVILPQI